MNTKANWLGITLKNPILLAPLTLISHKRIEEHVNYYERASKSGVGAIIVESLVPIEYGKPDISFTQNDLLPIESGLSKNQFMSFALLGAPYPNILSIKYGISLIKEICKQVTEVPIIGSLIGNFGEEHDVIAAAEMIAKAGVKGLELNFSCPNIMALCGEEEKGKINLIYRHTPSLSLIKSIKKHTGLGIALKLIPGCMPSSLDSNIFRYIDGITYSNAHLGIVPPSIESPPFGSPFKRGFNWSYSGIYGPFERLLTYGVLVKIKKDPIYKDTKLSIVGGLVEEKHIVESLLLGADTVQISSAILWKGFKFVSSAVAFLEAFMQKNGFASLDDFRGQSLNYIDSCATNLKEYEYCGTEKPHNQLQTVTITSKCIKCYKCLGMCCLALYQDENNTVRVKKDLCSGCGWCQIICPVEAIVRES